MQDGWKHGWSRFIGSGCLFLTTLLFLCATCQADPKPCIYRKGHTWPACNIHQDMIVEHGLPGRFHCSTSWVARNARRSDLEILIDNKIAEANRITIKDANTIAFRWDHLPPSEFTFACRVKSKGKYDILTRIKVSIAVKPKEPRNFECTSYNWENVVCTWEPVPTYAPTRFSLRSEPQGLLHSKSSFDCSVYQGKDTPPQNKCVWNATIDPSYRLIGKNYNFTLDAENVLGTKSFTYQFDHWAHMIPSSPINLSVPNITSTTALLRWTVPLALQNFPPGFHHRFYYQNPSKGSQNWHTLDITNETHAEDILLSINNLEANTVYTVRVSIKSALAVGEDKWGQFSEVTFKTLEEPLDLPPRSDIGSFEIVQNGDNRDIYIYWKGIGNGDHVPYKVVRVEPDGRTSEVKPDKITETYAKIPGIGVDGAKFYIVPADQTGLENPIATAQVPSQFEIPPKPDVFTKIAFDKGVYELPWNSSSNPDITNYTIFWCESGGDRPDHCSGDLDWVHVPGNTNIYNVTVPDPKKTYRFAIAANTPRASSGMTWFSALDLPPRSDIGSFEIVGDGDNRDIYIYWKGIGNGDHVPYKVVRVEPDGRTSEVKPDKITETYAKIPGIGVDGAKFYIVPANQTGLKNPIATAQVPSQFKIPPKPDVFTKIAFDKGIYELSWNSSSNQGITDYTIFWCESGRDRPYQCSGDLDWVRVPGNINIHNVTVPDPKKTYRFAIAANTPQASSGMTWFPDTTTPSNDVGKVKMVRINRLESDEIEVGVDLDYSGRIGTVEGLNIYYCRVMSPDNCDGPEISTTVVTNPHPTHAQGVIHDLRPGTTYMLTTAVLSKDGEKPRSEPLYFTTQATLNPTTESTSPENTPLTPTTVLPVTKLQTFIEERSTDVKDFIKELIEKLENNLGDKLNARIYGVNSKINDLETQISNLTLTISALENKFDSITEENCKLRNDLDKCTEELLSYKDNTGFSIGGN